MLVYDDTEISVQQKGYMKTKSGLLKEEMSYLFIIISFGTLFYVNICQ